jgi:ABC-type antimicrobial peptide transport system permease subunit
LASFWRAFASDRAAVVGAVVIGLTALVSLTIPLYSPYDPIVPISGIRLAPPLTPGHLPITDGRAVRVRVA